MSFAWTISFLSLIGFGILYTKLSFTGTCSKDKGMYEHLHFGCLLLAFLLVRLLLARFAPFYPSDMNCWKAWGIRMEHYGASTFYAPDYFCDYPPAYLYVLGFLSHIATWLHLPDTGYVFLLKLPAIFSDICIGILLFHYAGRHMSYNNATILASCFLLAPVFLYDSAVWGQIESVLLLFLLLSLLQLLKKCYCWGVFFYVIAVLLKPQGLILAPIVLLSVLFSKNGKAILLSLCTGILTFYALTIPFSPAWQAYSGLSLPIHLLNPVWMIEKYLATLSSYPYFSVNAFNFYGLLNLNWVELGGLFSAFVNLVILMVAVLGSLFLFMKIKDKENALWLSSYFLFGFLYTFAFKMHERYLILPAFFLLPAFVSSKNKKLLFLFFGFCCMGFLNMYQVMHLALSTQTMPTFGMVFPIAALEVSLFLFSLWVIVRDFVLSPDISQKKVFVFHPLKHYRFLPILRGSHGLRQKKMTRLDVKLLSGIVLVYASTAFLNLGDTKAPQTQYQPETEGETFTITLNQTETIHEIDYYCGPGDVARRVGMKVSYSLDGENWTNYPEPLCRLRTVFYWDVEPLETEIVAKYLRFTATSTDYMLFEAGLRNQNGALVTIDSCSAEKASAIFDEQEFVTNMPTYQNSTYFDEIYHPRTAFEHLHKMPYYETTHPPLGKLIMTLGIALFGMTPFGWRFCGTLFGVLMLPIFYLFIKRLFGRTRYAVIGTLLFAFDFMHFGLTRLATIDSYPVFFILGMYYFMYLFGEHAIAGFKSGSVSYKKLMGYLMLSGLSMGLGCASKWTAIYAAAGLAVEFAGIMLYLCFLNRKNRGVSFGKFTFSILSWCLLVFLALPMGVYLLSYLPISMVDGYGNVFEVMWENQAYMLNYHANLQGSHPYASPWYSWPFVYKPMWAYQAPQTSIPDGTIGCISIFQNPLLSWLGILSFVYSLAVGWKKKDLRVAFLLIGLLSQYLPWILVSRYALQYHFFATMVFLILFTIYAIQDLEKRFERFGYVSSALVGYCLFLFLLFYPVLSGTPIPRSFAENVLRWFDSWVFFI